MSPIAKTFGQVRRDEDAAGAVGTRTKPIGRRRRCNARGPQDRRCRQSLPVDHDTIRRALRNRLAKTNVNAESDQRTPGVIG